MLRVLVLIATMSLWHSTAMAQTKTPQDAIFHTRLKEFQDYRLSTCANLLHLVTSSGRFFSEEMLAIRRGGSNPFRMKERLKVIPEMLHTLQVYEAMKCPPIPVFKE